jgi:hypothetical protein
VNDQRAAMGGVAAPAGSLGLTVVRADGSREDIPPRLRVVRQRPVPWPAEELSVRGIAHYGLPRKGLDERINDWRTRNARHLWRGVRRVLAARALHLPTFYGTLYLTHIRADGEVLELGLASMRVITTAGVNFLVDAFQGSVEPEILKFHGIGTGAVAEASGDTALGAESTTALVPDNTRATGSLGEGASANIYRTVGTVTVDAAVANTEHGILSQAATGGGILWDRSVYSVVNLAINDSLQATYDATFPAGG